MTKEQSPEPAKQKRPGGLKWIALILIAGLLGTLYWQRDRLRGPSTDNAGAAERKILYYFDPMHPAYKSDRPGTAPDCGMDLVPVYSDGGAQSAASFPAGTVQISPEKQQLIGVQYTQASIRNISRTLRTVGRVTYDETKISHVHTKYEGWIEEVYVDFTGKLIKAGQPLLTIYSPELLQTQQEFLLARRGRTELADSPFRESVYGANSIYEAARKRLELWDVTDQQIAELERSGTPTRAIPLFAPAGGFVTTRNAFPKQRVMPDTELYTIADLSNVWVVADVYESEAPEIRIGQTATVMLSYFSGRVFQGKLSYIYPQLDNTTRTLKVRIEVPNPGFALKPDMYADIAIQIDYGRQVVVPQEAVMDSGAEQQVFIAHEGGYFEPRRVTLGAKADQDVIVLAGLKAGEKIVTSANFLIDSESRLKSATGGMGAPGDHQHGSAPMPAPTIRSPKEDHSRHLMDPTPTPVSAEGKVLYYYCTMHPEQRSDKPGACPLCKMRLVPRMAGEKEAVKHD